MLKGSLQVFCKAANLSIRVFCDGCISFCSLPVIYGSIATLKHPEYLLKTHLASEVDFYGNISIYDSHKEHGTDSWSLSILTHEFTAKTIFFFANVLKIYFNSEWTYFA